MLQTLSREQLILRAGMLSATDIVKISGYAPAYMGDLIGVYAAKTEGPSLQTDPEGNEDIERGIFGEPFLRDWFAYRTKRLIRQPGTMTNPRYPLLCATPDGISWDPANPDAEERILEIKYPRWPWGWEEDAPPHYRIQAQVQMGIAGLSGADIVAPINGDLKIYPQTFNADLFATLRQLAEKFWRDHVLARVPPPPNASKAYSAWLAAQYPEDLDPDLIPAPAEAKTWVLAYKEAGEEKRRAEERQREARNHLVAMIGTHAGLQDEEAGIKATFKKCKDSIVIDHAAIVAACLDRIPAEIIAAHTKTKSGHRSIKVY